MENNKAIKSLTNKSYWEKYYKENKSDSRFIELVGSAFDNFWNILIDSCEFEPKSIIEIGAYPGRYIAYLADRFNLRPTALDFNSDQTKIIESFDSMGVADYSIIQQDFTNYNPSCSYDIVVSIGFIEHFDNFNYILDLHCKYLSPGGAMIIIVPNKTYLRKFYGNLLDKKNLSVHNLKCMNKKVFQEFAKRNDLKIKYLEFAGGFSYKVHQDLNFFKRILYWLVRNSFIRFNRILVKYPSKYYSGSLVGIFSKSFN